MPGDGIEPSWPCDRGILRALLLNFLPHNNPYLVRILCSSKLIYYSNLADFLHNLFRKGLQLLSFCALGLNGHTGVSLL